MDEQTSTQPPINNIPPSQPSQNPVVPQIEHKSNIKLWIGLILLILVIGIGVGIYYVNYQKKAVASDQTSASISGAPSQEQVSQQSSKMNVESVFVSAKNTYGGNIPWENIAKKEAHQYFPKEIKDLVVANDQISVNYDTSYNPIVTFEFEEFSVPVKNSYITYYSVPEVNNEEYNLGEFDYLFPLMSLLYEFDRPLTTDELAFIEKGDLMKCFNKNAEISFSLFTDNNVVATYCNYNLTPDQSKQITQKEFFDVYYVVYFKKENVVLQVGMDSRHIKDTNAYMTDYLFKVLNSNPNLVVDERYVETVQQSREFEEWRHKTFDK